MSKLKAIVFASPAPFARNVTRYFPLPMHYSLLTKGAGFAHDFSEDRPKDTKALNFEF